MLARLRTVVFCASYLLPQAASAMDFWIVRQGNAETVMARGPIVPGDAERLRPLLGSISRTNLGNKFVTIQDSPGGSVDAAYEIASVMDSIGNVGTIVDSKASCASACASILFIAGKLHIIIPGGRIGLHTCYGGFSRTANPLCNQKIAQFALEHGTAFNSVYLFMDATPPDGMMWFSAEEADCWGLTKFRVDPPGWNQCVYDVILRSACATGQASACRKLGGQ